MNTNVFIKVILTWIDRKPAYLRDLYFFFCIFVHLVVSSVGLRHLLAGGGMWKVHQGS